MYPRPYFYVPAWDDGVFEVDIIDLLPCNMDLVQVINSDRIGLCKDYNYTFATPLKYIFKTRKQVYRSRKRCEKSIKKRQNKQENNS